MSLLNTVLELGGQLMCRMHEVLVMVVKFAHCVVVHHIRIKLSF